MPSQVLIRSASSSSNNNSAIGNNGNSNSTRRRRNRSNRGQRDNKKDEVAREHQQGEDAKKEAPTPNRKQNRKKTNRKRAENESRKQSHERQQQKQSSVNEAKNPTTKPKKNRRRRNQPWKRHLPPEAVDPITLEPLASLHYPPFALAAVKPYDPIPVWPIPEPTTKADSEEERRRRVLAEQWGEHRLHNDDDSKKPPLQQPQQQHVNLYDGRALAYYMVSQLQFIDPLNRRDLTRDELVNLDHYLKKHGYASNKYSVTEAFDAKGVTLSTAGAAGHTAAGRAAILQQQAAVLLSALFGGGGGEAAAPTVAATTTNSLMQQYQAHEQSGSSSTRRPPQTARHAHQPPTDTGISGGAGLLVIDDDLHPALRSSAPEFVPGSGSLWSARHIAERYSHASRIQEHDFPSLSANSPQQMQQGQPPQQEDNKKPPPAPASKTLSVIKGAIQKTDPQEVQRQFEAREAARRRALLSNMTFGADHAATEPTGLMLPHTTTSSPTPSQLERNRAFAQALDIAPARNHHNSGWARPAEGLDAFGNELAATVYPDSFILRAKELVPLVLKLEKKWKKFLADDTAASLPLGAMDRPSRAFCHEYAAYWKLHTESFDPEPARYVHCVKLRDTSAPCPLLSDAARHWRGPSQPALIRPLLEHPSRQTAGQSTGRELPPPPDRVPLPLKPRSTELPSSRSEAEPLVTGGGGIPIGGAPSRSTSSTATSRFASLESTQRPKLTLAKRTLPLELPPFEQQPTDNSRLSEELLLRQEQRQAEKLRKKQEREARKQRILEQEFASDDEKGSVVSSTSSAWEEPQQMYAGSDDEENA